eukprot:Gb_16114 [translate_table: standard]
MQNSREMKNAVLRKRDRDPDDDSNMQEDYKFSKKTACNSLPANLSESQWPNDILSMNLVDMDVSEQTLQEDRVAEMMKYLKEEIDMPIIQPSKDNHAVYTASCPSSQTENTAGLDENYLALEDLDSSKSVLMDLVFLLDNAEDQLTSMKYHSLREDDPAAEIFGGECKSLENILENSCNFNFLPVEELWQFNDEVKLNADTLQGNEGQLAEKTDDWNTLVGTTTLNGPEERKTL